MLHYRSPSKNLHDAVGYSRTAELPTQYLHHRSTNFSKPGSHLKILDTRNVTQSRVHTDDPQKFGVTAQISSIVARTT